MTREIKFRAWDPERKKMIFGPTDDNPSSSWVLALPQREDFPIPIMQFTGLRAFKQEVFEGDIIGMPEESDDEKGYTGKPLGIVKYRKGVFVIDCFNGNLFDLYSEEGRIKIFGNIHENSELLEA